MLRRTLIPQSETAEGAAKARRMLVVPADGSGEVALDAMLLDTRMPKRKPFDLFVSGCLHMAFIGVVLVAPILFTRQIALAKSEITMLSAPPTVPYAPAPPMGARASFSKATFTAPKLIAPVSIPKMTSAAAPAAAQAAPDLSAGLGGVAGGVPGGVLGGLLGGNGVSAPPPPTPAGMLHVGGQVQRPELVFNPEPEYPKQAKKAKIQGDVKIDAIVDKDGNVVQAHAISGPPVLVDAALKAVTQWKYQPTYLNGSPYPLELIVDVSFHLG
jgi:periplasmic protein TonB